MELGLPSPSVTIVIIIMITIIDLVINSKLSSVRMRSSLKSDIDVKEGTFERNYEKFSNSMSIYRFYHGSHFKIIFLPFFVLKNC